MSHRWRYERTDGTAVTGPELTFGDQEEAEAWFTDAYPDLAQDGVEQVVLLRTDDDGTEHRVYGPMLLSE